MQLQALEEENRELRTAVQNFGTAAAEREAREEARRARNIEIRLHLQAPRQRFYAVARGTTPGVYGTSAEATRQTLGVNGSMQHRFNIRAEASAYIEEFRDPEVQEQPLYVLDRVGAEDSDEEDMNEE